MFEVNVTVNNEKHCLLVDANETLLDTLRDRLHLTGSKRGCDTGDCGACTVLLNGDAINACLILAVEADGADIRTIEGIHHPIQEEFILHGAFGDVAQVADGGADDVEGHGYLPSALAILKISSMVLFLLDTVILR